MPRKRKNSFESALQDAQDRLTTAVEERSVAQKKMAALDIEIPALQRTIQALKQQLGGPQPILSQENIDTLDKKYYGPVLENNPELKAIVEAGEEDLLPDPEGTEIIE